MRHSVVLNFHVPWFGCYQNWLPWSAYKQIEQLAPRIFGHSYLRGYLDVHIKQPQQQHVDPGLFLPLTYYFTSINLQVLTAVSNRTHSPDSMDFLTFFGSLTLIGFYFTLFLINFYFSCVAVDSWIPLSFWVNVKSYCIESLVGWLSMV